jgi:glycosyltransferase involved in cell wall biosynthesis
MSSISIVVPAFNSAPFLPQTLSSVFGQSHEPREVIVVNDGSQDDTDDVVVPYLDRIEYVKQENGGVSAARNAGLERVASDYVIFLDADDCLTKGALSAFGTAVQRNPKAGVFYGDLVTVDIKGNLGGVRSRTHFAGDAPFPARQLFTTGGHPPSAFMTSTEVARSVGGFDSRFTYCADLDFFMRCGAVASFVHVPEVVVRYLEHDAAMSRNARRAVQDQVDVRLAFVEWCEARSLGGIVETKSELEMFTAIAKKHFYMREWHYLDVALKEAEARGLDSPQLAWVRRMRLFPKWLYRLKDGCDTVVGRFA